MTPRKPKKNTLLYAIITVLSFSLILLASITIFSLNKLYHIQMTVNNMQESVLEMTQTVAQITSETQQLYQVHDQASQAEPAPDSVSQAEPAPDSANISTEEGTLSPPSGTSTLVADDSLGNLMQQVNASLPLDNGNWSVYVCNLMKDSEEAINDHQMQAASLIKLFIMGTVYENYERLSQQYGAQTIDEKIRYMITVSDNQCANDLVTYLGNNDANAGMALVNNFCQNHGYLNTHMGRLLLAPNTTDDNYTSVGDCGRFLKEIYQIVNGTCQNPTLTSAENMYYYLKLQERRNKIPRNLPTGVKTANKTGELGDVENDAGIIYETGKVDTVICFMSENLSNAGAAQNTIAELSRQIYSYYNN